MVAGQVRQRACEEQAVHSMAARSTAEKGLGRSLSIREAPPVTLLLQLEPPPQVFIEASAAGPQYRSLWRTFLFKPKASENNFDLALQYLELQKRE